MKKIKTIVICFMLFTGMNQFQAQMGKLKSLAGSSLNKKAAEKKTAPIGKYSDIQANMTDADLEKQGLALINEKATNEKWNEKYTKAKIVSKDWEVVKNELTGAVLQRKIYMSLYGVWPDGKCKAVGFSFLQDYDGNKFSSKLQYNAIGDMDQVECE